jgi:hypothetical protein
MPSVLFTYINRESKFEISNEISEEQSENIWFVLLAKLVLKLDKFKNFNFLHL